jgi:hypothetical protein
MDPEFEKRARLKNGPSLIQAQKNYLLLPTQT